MRLVSGLIVDNDLVVQGNVNPTGTLTIGGVTPWLGLPVVKTQVETADRAISTTLKDLIDISAIALSPVPDGSRKYKVNFAVVTNSPDAATETLKLQVYLGPNGNSNDTLIRTFNTRIFNGAFPQTMEQMFVIQPTITETRIGVAYQSIVAITADIVGTKTFMTITEIK